MNRISVAVIIGVVVSLGSCGAVYGASFGDIFGGNKAQEYKAILEEKEQECQERLQKKEDEYQRLFNESKDARGAIESMREKNSTLMEAYEKIKTDYDKVVEQVKRVRRESQQCTDVQSSYDQMKKEQEAYLGEKQSLEKRMETSETTVENLKLHLKEVTAEKDQLAVFLAEAQEDEDVKIKKIRDSVKDEVANLEKQVAILEQENTSIAKTLEETEKELRITQLDNSGLNQKLELLQEELKASEKEYAALKKENRYLAQEATQFPKKFADLARHNRKLVKETADMHYNLGVFYFGQREFKRAIPEFRKTLELRPHDKEAMFNLALIYAEHRIDREKAIEYLTKYIKLDNKSANADWAKKYIIKWEAWRRSAEDILR